MPNPEAIGPQLPPPDRTVGESCLAPTNPFPARKELPAVAPLPAPGESMLPRVLALGSAAGELKGLIARLQGTRGMAATAADHLGHLPESQARQRIIAECGCLAQLSAQVEAEAVRVHKALDLAAAELVGAPWAQEQKP